MTAQPSITHIPAIGFGDRLRRLRLDLGLDQRGFADEVGIHHATLGRYESAAGAPRASQLVAAAVQLRFGTADIDLRRWLLTGDTQPTDYGFLQVVAA